MYTHSEYRDGIDEVVHARERSHHRARAEPHQELVARTLGASRETDRGDEEENGDDDLRRDDEIVAREQSRNSWVLRRIEPDGQPVDESSDDGPDRHESERHESDRDARRLLEVAQPDRRSECRGGEQSSRDGATADGRPDRKWMRIGPDRRGNRGEEKIRRRQQRQRHEEEQVVQPLSFPEASPQQDGREQAMIVAVVSSIA